MNNPTTFDPRPTFIDAQEWVAGLVAGTEENDRHSPTPCEEMDVTGLLTHLVVVWQKIVGLGREGSDPFAPLNKSMEELIALQAKIESEEVTTRSITQIAERLRNLAAEAQEAWTADRLSSTVTLGWGPQVTGAEALSTYLMEVTAHGWDLAQATRQNCEAPAAVAESALATAGQWLPPEMPRGQANGIPFDAAVTPPAGAGTTTQLACFLGRRPFAGV